MNAGSFTTPQASRQYVLNKCTGSKRGISCSIFFCGERTVRFLCKYGQHSMNNRAARTPAVDIMRGIIGFVTVVAGNNMTGIDGLRGCIGRQRLCQRGINKVILKRCARCRRRWRHWCRSLLQYDAGARRVVRFAYFQTGHRLAALHDALADALLNKAVPPAPRPGSHAEIKRACLACVSPT